VDLPAWTTTGRLDTLLSAFGVPVLGVPASVVLWWSITAAFSIRPCFVPSGLTSAEELAGEPQRVRMELACTPSKYL
jgi:hypothetical protein